MREVLGCVQKPSQPHREGSKTQRARMHIYRVLRTLPSSTDTKRDTTFNSLTSWATREVGPALNGLGLSSRCRNIAVFQRGLP